MKRKKLGSKPGLTRPQRIISHLWEKHVKAEFEKHDVEATIATMIREPYVNNVPVMTGGVGRNAVREFYAKHFIPKLPPDTRLMTISRTIGSDRLAEELIFKFTHTIEMDWMVPGVPPTGKRVELPMVAVVQFKNGKVAHEHIYWDQASVLVQLDLMEPDGLPVSGVESARKVLELTKRL